MTALRVARQDLRPFFTPRTLADYLSISELPEGYQWIYAIQAGGYGDDIKLGISRDPVARLRTLQTAHSEKLRGVGAWPGTVEDERALHEQYAGLRIRGEWFMHSLPLWRLVRDFGGGFRWPQ